MIALASGANITLNADGSHTVNPVGKLDHRSIGEQVTDTVDYTVSDRKGGLDTAKVSVAIDGAGSALPSLGLSHGNWKIHDGSPNANDWTVSGNTSFELYLGFEAVAIIVVEIVIASAATTAASAIVAVAKRTAKKCRECYLAWSSPWIFQRHSLEIIVPWRMPACCDDGSQPADARGNVFLFQLIPRIGRTAAGWAGMVARAAGSRFGARIGKLGADKPLPTPGHSL